MKRNRNMFLAPAQKKEKNANHKIITKWKTEQMRETQAING